MKFQGIFPPVITPYNIDGSINETDYVVMLEHLIDSGVHGIIVGGTTGEYYAQSTQERERLTQTANKVINKRVPLIVGIGAIRTEDCIEHGVLARKNGADAVLLGSPYYAVPTQLELVRHALAIDRAVDLPIILYNYPGRTGTMMQAEFLDRVGRSSNFCAIKESSGDINQVHLLARDYPHIDLLCGMDDQALEFFVWGAKGWVCAGSNCLPAEHLALYQACAIEKDYAKGRRIMSALMPFMHTLEQGGKFIQSVKYACELAGLPAGELRSPIGPLNKEEKRQLTTVLRTLKPTVANIVAA